MTNDIERHSPEVWRKAADSLRGEADASDAVAKVNRNGAPLLGDTRDLFRPKTGDIPAQPGVYKWRDGEGRVIYVGKAKSLRNRLTNYFQPLYLLHPRTQTMVLTARSLEWTVVGTELEALTLEYTWIKEFDPRFNVQFRDDKTYPYLAISSGEAVPRVWVTRSRKRRDARYFGPYAKVWELRQSLDKLLRTFPVRTCTTNVFHKAELTGRPCLLASIGKCSAPCIGRIAPKEHRHMCEHLVGVMTGRLGKSYIAQLTRDMKDASAELEFEKAARLRDEIQMLQTVMQQNAVVFDQDVDADVFGMASDELEASVHAFIVRDGSIRGERNWSVERVEDVSDGELIDDLIMQVYSDVAADNGLNVDPHDGTAPSMASPSGNGGVSTVEGGASIVERRDAIGSTQTVTAKSSVERAQATRTRRERQEQTGRADLLAPIAPVPREVIVPVEPARRAELESWLSGLRGAVVTIRVASRGEKKALMNRANENAGQALQRSKMSRISDMGTRTAAMNDVAKALGLAQAPLRIECYDISNTVGGAFQVASMVVFEDAIAKKSEYRRFAIRGDDGKGALDDLSALYETLTRRFRHGNIAGDSGDSMDNERRAESSDTSASTTTASSPDGIRDAGVVQQNTNRHHFAYIPNLVVVDGGHPQVMAAAKALADCGVNDVAVCGLAKRLEEVWVPDDEYPIILKRQSEGMYLLQRVRDESHRFAITYHRQTRRKGALRSALDGIPGVGETYQKRLLSHFGSVRAMRDASVEELEAVKGIGHAKAEAIHAALHVE
ncbi:excinuclease ABC subunit UvrC [Bifidobacterium bifidum]|uniref:excinuclease ABC subunit UvrC n=1 Tax=Bifidobacterium bifidum TaxID=1681 RepID=UPI000E4517ED|nr:excinuclease ABC subunit UvrC [Bifidobacterium bifidum]RGL59300.1 excinuclease ABC subunit UvrC [Bifidobacterium bifidum]RGL62119.1 excinuclease ABC subunit UvrC [Bifidobacterium bifidum]RHH18152.1 excinuclease ABC subunit UvrC [Bifidobacterium bifidum]RHH28468.1 excinuclease ABC subunit UvrC [Bifidobacterium bifidum]RHH29676.1 excinuclease ABC subunit UvrC [Bifidobacterium bifidum]